MYLLVNPLTSFLNDKNMFSPHTDSYKMDRNHSLWKALLLLIPQSLPWLHSSPSSLGQSPCPSLKRCAQSTSPCPTQNGIFPAIEWSYLGHEPLVYLSPFPGKIDMVPILLYGRQPFPDPPNPLVALTAGTAYPHLKCVVLRKPHTEGKTSTAPCPCSPLSPSLPCFVQPPNSICWLGLYYFMTYISAVSSIPFHEQDWLHDGSQLHVDDNDVLRVFLLCHFMGSFTHQEGIRGLVCKEPEI